MWSRSCDFIDFFSQLIFSVHTGCFYRHIYLCRHWLIISVLPKCPQKVTLFIFTYIDTLPLPLWMRITSPVFSRCFGSLRLHTVLTVSNTITLEVYFSSHSIICQMWLTRLYSASLNVFLWMLKACSATCKEMHCRPVCERRQTEEATTKEEVGVCCNLGEQEEGGETFTFITVSCFSSHGMRKREERGRRAAEKWGRLLLWRIYNLGFQKKANIIFLGIVSCESN